MEAGEPALSDLYPKEHLALLDSVHQIERMATRAHDASTQKKGNKTKSKVLGRSAATGKFVLRPASKGGKLSMRAANTAVKHILEKRH